MLGRFLKVRIARESLPFLLPNSTAGRQVEVVSEPSKVSIFVKFHSGHVSNNSYINEENIRRVFDIPSSLTSSDSSSERVANLVGKTMMIQDVSIRKLTTDKVCQYCVFEFMLVFVSAYDLIE